MKLWNLVIAFFILLVVFGGCSIEQITGNFILESNKSTALNESSQQILNNSVIRTEPKENPVVVPIKIVSKQNDEAIGICVKNNCIVDSVQKLKKNINAAIKKNYDFLSYTDDEAGVKYTSSFGDYFLIVEILNESKFIHNDTDSLLFNVTFNTTKIRNLTIYANATHFQYNTVLEYNATVYTDTPYGKIYEKRGILVQENNRTYEKMYIYTHYYRIWCGNNVLLSVRDITGLDNVQQFGLNQDFLPSVNNVYDANNKEMLPILYRILKTCPVGQASAEQDKTFMQFEENYKKITNKDLFYIKNNETDTTIKYLILFDKNNQISLVKIKSKSEFINSFSQFKEFVEKENTKLIADEQQSLSDWINSSVINKYNSEDKYISKEYISNQTEQISDNETNLISNTTISFYYYIINQVSAQYKRTIGQQINNENIFKVNYKYKESVLCRPDLIVNIYATPLETGRLSNLDSIKNNVQVALSKDGMLLDSKAEQIQQVCAGMT